MMNFREDGFTLIELLVVIFTIGLLAGILLPNFVSSRERARDARRKHDLNEIKTALRLYYNDNQSYPEVVSFGTSWPPYMQVVPNDPLEERTYGYCVDDNRDKFLLFAQLENRGDSDINSSAARCGVSSGTWSGGACDDLDDCFSGETNLCYYVCGD